jgi:tripartite-type tricarboxylate transporter receptor subunit TctC
MALPQFALPGLAQWPDRPIKLIVPFAAGSSSDTIARIVAARMGERLGAQIVVENRVGGSGIIATEAVARSAPDGYTLLWASTNVIAIVPATTKTPYDPVKDFAPVSALGESPQVLLVNSKVPAKNVAELIVAKHRNGPTGQVKLTFLPNLTQFRNYASGP